MYSGYSAISEVYDSINADVNYSEWANFIEKCFERYLEKKPEIVLDLACGTGSMTFELARRGYDMIGVDGSEDMLSLAYDRKYELEDAERVLFLRQDMRSFELYGTVGAVTCCLDSINYLTEDQDLSACFSLVHNYLDPDGIFLFDVNTPYKFENIYADNAYLYETENSLGNTSFCAWQNDYDKESRLCRFYLSVFTEDENGKYLREDEEQSERCYSADEIKKTLSDCGFELLGFFGDYSFSTPSENCERWYVAARAKK